MTFKEFLANRRPHFNARSDFTRLANVDPDFPDATTLGDVQSYIQANYGNEMIWHAAAGVWEEYQTSVRKSVRGKLA